MEIIEVKQNWNSDVLKVDLTIGNICNYKCWYCFDGCNTGTVKWPEFDNYTKNISHLLNYYLEHTDKKKFDFNIMGGEVTHWKRFFDFIKYFKDRYDCIFTLTSNGTKSLEWWSDAAPYLDFVLLSAHHEFADIYHVRNVADLLYSNLVHTNVSVLMDPNVWDKCMIMVETLKQSKHKWSIRYAEIINQDSISYNKDQKEILNKVRARKPNLLWFLRTNKSYRSRVKIVDSTNVVHKVNDSKIVLERLNQFKDWECNLGIDWIAIKMDGELSGICGNNLYNDLKQYNIHDENFMETFAPTITHTPCQQYFCWCSYEANMPKRKISNTRKIIPIQNV